MPTYEYRCGHCGHEFEVLQSMTAEPLKKCPQCGRKSVERLISAGAGLIFKGGGFYVTDYRRGSSDQPKGSESSSGETGSKGSDTKSTADSSD